MTEHPQDLSLRDQSAAVARGELDPGELLDATLERIGERDPELNSFAATFPDESRRMLAEAPPGPLHGIPVAVKDMFALPWRAPRDGTPHEQLPAGESGVYRLLRDAGAVIVGVTNMHFWGGGSTGHVSAYGPVGNPWDSAHCGGGSSGGSAAAVGARLVAGAVGTDGGGSIRLPAAYCGVTGLKGTYGATPPGGYTHRFSSLGVGGPMCRDAADARLLGEVLFSRALAPGDGAALRVGIVRAPFWADVDPEIERACEDALEAAGWATEEIAIAGAEHSRAATVLRLTLEALPSTRPEEVADAHPLMRALIKYEKLLPARHLVQADRVRALLRRELARAFEQVDLIAWPTVPAPAPPIANPTVQLPSGPSPADPANVGQTGIGNLSGVPGISVPVGTHSSGLPMALQLQAAWGREQALLDAAEHLERTTARQFVDAVPPIAAATAT
ncbi:MAG: aspartyl-tRNA(Asn)/glutamyl-tRNA(Gln) amidotransferase subunit [Thermoleophilaceae bacterium]|nr:aspartyl-tRNA(Asn)/glutamyl-tRNA(Gln) amidotransferase subunit [Thermoleophilaceae bacterium]